MLVEELSLLGQFGLRNKRELWKHRTALTKYRDLARSLLGARSAASSRTKSELLARLHRLGLVGAEAVIDDVLDLTIGDMLERRLQTQVFRLGLANSQHQARQLVAHGHISVGGHKITSPSYIVRQEDENQIIYSPESSLNNPDHPVRMASAPRPAITQGGEDEVRKPE